MKMTAVKEEKEIRLDGIKAEITKKDHNVIRVVFRDTSGNFVEVGKDGYSDLTILIPAPPEKKKVWNLKGEIAGIKVNENFDDEYDAKRRRSEIISKLSVDESGFSIEQIEVEVVQ